MTSSLKLKIYLCYIRKKSKNSYKKRKNENFEKQKKVFFHMSQGSLNPNIRFLGQKVCPIGLSHTDTHTPRQSDYRGHHFSVLMIFPSSYQGSAHKMQGVNFTCFLTKIAIYIMMGDFKLGLNCLVIFYSQTGYFLLQCVT